MLSVASQEVEQKVRLELVEHIWLSKKLEPNLYAMESMFLDLKCFAEEVEAVDWLLLQQQQPIHAHGGKSSGFGTNHHFKS